MTQTWTLALVMFGLAGCSSVQLKPDQLARAEASQRGAEELGAANVPDAKLHLQLAREQTATAKKMADRGDERAPLVLARATADGELAVALAREAEVHEDALAASVDLDAVRARSNP